MAKIKIAITHGDINGTGYEIIFKTFAAPEILEYCVPIVYGSPQIAKDHLKALGMEANFTVIESPKEAVAHKINIIPAVADNLKAELGKQTDAVKEAANQAIEKALADYREGLLNDIIVTAPLNNSVPQCHSFLLPSQEDENIQNKPITLFVNPRIKIAVASENLSDSQEAPSKELVVSYIESLRTALKTDFRTFHPRIAVLGTPSQPEDTKTEWEEAISELQGKAVPVYGPYPEEEFLDNEKYQNFDAVLAQNSQQAYNALSRFNPDEGYCYTAAMPLIRTAPSHASQPDLAGKNSANENSFRQAVYAAIDIHRNRASYQEAYANPLPKLFHEKKDEGEKIRFNIPEKKHKSPEAPVNQ